MCNKYRKKYSKCSFQGLNAVLDILDILDILDKNPQFNMDKSPEDEEKWIRGLTFNKANTLEHLCRYGKALGLNTLEEKIKLTKPGMSENDRTILYNDVIRYCFAKYKTRVNHSSNNSSDDSSSDESSDDE